MSVFTEMPDGPKFKAYEKDNATFLPKKTYAVIRFDGKNFSSFTKRYEKPYDLKFMGLMDTVTQLMAKQVPGALFGYTQSDEISIVFSDLKENALMWYDGKVAKMLSVGAATVTALFMQQSHFDEPGQLPVFDARVHPLGSYHEVEEYVRWRRFDAQKNAVTMAANTLRSHKQLMSVSSKERAAILAGTELEKLPDGFYNGRVTYREQFMKDDAVRNRWVSVPADRAFMESKFDEFQVPECLTSKTV